MVSRNLVVCIALCVGALGPERGENESFFEKEVAGVRVIAFSAEDLRDAGKELSEEEGLDFDELYTSIAKCAGIEFEFLTGMNTPTIVFAMSQAADERQCGFEGFPIIRRTLKPSKRKLEEHCDLGFFENEDECTPCNHVITYCSECENGSVCTLCEDRFYTSGSECLNVNQNLVVLPVMLMVLNAQYAALGSIWSLELVSSAIKRCLAVRTVMGKMFVHCAKRGLTCHRVNVFPAIILQSL